MGRQALLESRPFGTALRSTGTIDRTGGPRHPFKDRAARMDALGPAVVPAASELRVGLVHPRAVARACIPTAVGSVGSVMRVTKGHTGVIPG